MENAQVNGFIYDEIGRLARRNFEAMLNYYERDLGYESGDEFDTDEPNTNSEIEADEAIENK